MWRTRVLPKTAFEEGLTAFAGSKGGRVRLSVTSPVAYLTIENPLASNSITGRMMAELRQHVRTLQQLPESPTTPTCLVLHADLGSPTFCGGADLRLVNDHLSTAEAGAAMCELMQETLTALHALPMVSVAAVHGTAVGGGAELVTACDFRVLTPSAHIWFKQVRVHALRCSLTRGRCKATMNTSTGWGGGSRLTRLVGRRAAIHLLCGASKVDAAEAVQLGLADGLTRNPQDCVTFATEYCRSRFVGAGGSEAIRALKGVVGAADEMGLKEALSEEADIFGSVWGGASNRAAVQQTSENILSNL